MSDERPERHEARLLKQVSDRLIARGWKVATQYRAGLYQVDMLATDPNRQVFAVELKVFRETIHFATLSNVAALRSGLPEGMEVQPVLLAEGEVTEPLQRLARELRVALFVTQTGTPEETAVSYFVDSLFRLSEDQVGGQP